MKGRGGGAAPSERLQGEALERFRELLRAEMNERTSKSVADACRVNERILRRVLAGRQSYVTLTVADQIATRLWGPGAWHTDPALRAFYEGKEKR